MKINVYGLGVVGTMTSIGLAIRGHDVSGLDIDSSKVEAIRSGRLPFEEKGLCALLDDALSERSKGSLEFAPLSDCSGNVAGVSVICVGSPGLVESQSGKAPLNTGY